MKFKTSLLSRPSAVSPRRFLSGALLAAAAPLACAWLAPAGAEAANDIVRLTFFTGDTVDFRLFPEAAPGTVENFLRYVTEGKYNETFIHRSEPGFVVQGGGYTAEDGGIMPIERFGEIANEFNQSNIRGTLAMARVGGEVDSATSEWFVNIADNTGLDSVDEGFTVFGELRTVKDMELFDAINNLPTFCVGEPSDGNPFTTVPSINDQNTPLWIVSAEVISRDETVNDRVHAWAGGNAVWDTASRNWQIVDGNGVAHAFTQGAEVVFDTPAGTRNDIVLGGGLVVADMRVGGAGTLVFNGNEYSGGITGQVGGVVPSNTGALLKEGSGMVAFQDAVLDFPGGVKVADGVLALDNALLQADVRVEQGASLLVGPNYSVGITGNILNRGTLQADAGMTGQLVLNGLLTNEGVMLFNLAVEGNILNRGVLQSQAGTTGRLVLNGSLTNEGVILLKLLADGTHDILCNNSTQPLEIGGTIKLDVAEAYFSGDAPFAFNFGEYFVDENGAGAVTLSPDVKLAFANPTFTGEITDWANGIIELRRSIAGVPVRSRLLQFRDALATLHQNDFGGDGGAFVGSLLNTANGYTDLAPVTQAIANASPLGYSSLASMSISLVDGNLAAVRARLAAFHNERAAAGASKDAPENINATSRGIHTAPVSAAYLSAGGAIAKNGTENTNPFYNTQTYSVGAGIDSPVTESLLAGFRVDGGVGNSDFHFGSGKARVEQFQATGYASVSLTGSIRADAAVFAAYASHSAKHYTLAGGAANNADARGVAAGAAAWLSGVFPLAKDFQLAPFAGVEFTRAGVNKFSESGGVSNGALSLDAFSLNSLRARVGAGLGWQFLPDARLSLNLAYARELLDTDAKLNARFAGSQKFRVNAPALSENTAEAGPSLEVKLSDATTVSAGYFFESDFASRTAHHFNASFLWRF